MSQCPRGSPPDIHPDSARRKRHRQPQKQIVSRVEKARPGPFPAFRANMSKQGLSALF